MLSKTEFTPTEMTQINKIGLASKRLAHVNHPLFFYPVTFTNTKEGDELKQILKHDFSGINLDDDKIPDTFSRLVYINTEYDLSETYYWVTDVNQVNFILYLDTFVKKFKKGGIFYA